MIYSALFSLRGPSPYIHAYKFDDSFSLPTNPWLPSGLKTCSTVPIITCTQPTFGWRPEPDRFGLVDDLHAYRLHLDSSYSGSGFGFVGFDSAPVV